MKLIDRVADERTYPAIPIWQIPAPPYSETRKVLRGARREAHRPALNLYTLPGRRRGRKPAKRFVDAVIREVREETCNAIRAASHWPGITREVIARDNQGKVERHFVILCFAARWHERANPCSATNSTIHAGSIRRARELPHHRRPGRECDRRSDAAGHAVIRLAIAVEPAHTIAPEMPEAIA